MQRRELSGLLTIHVTIGQHEGTSAMPAGAQVSSPDILPHDNQLTII